ncbi:hypothetical protein ACFQPA_00805 [Halomarina halobia]|uniref:Fenitrothion hydrolase n=1 Tax=Halomarina halobia TaxID=3033386 RepID=A0ABD6A703_9EURY|nr:hypothetical protein [Halomarina sp. PSR21]
MPPRGRRATAIGSTVLLAGSLLAGTALAHAGSLGSAEPVSVPSWLFALTGGGVVVASFLFTSFVTDRDLIRAAHERGPTLPAGALLTAGGRALAVVGVVGLAAVVLVGLFGPPAAVANLAVLLVWVGWWAGYAMSVYLVGNTWPALNPWGTLAERLPSLDRPYPERLGAWPSVAALLALVWLEVVSPVADAPRLLAAVVVGYTALTLAGAVVFGRETWFATVDPVARVFRYYGAIAPVQRLPGAVALRAPGAALTGDGTGVAVPADQPTGRDRSVRADGAGADAAIRGIRRPLVDGFDEVAFVVALVWATTFDGFVSTAAWAALARPVVALGVPPLAAYLAALVCGFALFLGAYRTASRLARRSAGTYVATREIERRFVLALLPIAAGYHLAHFLGYFLALSPTLAAVLTDPLAPPTDLVVLTLPGWFGGVQLASVVVGHLVAVWVAHATAFETFTGRLQPVRSQYPYVVLMAVYTTTSMWLLMQPYAPPPYL